MGDLCWYMGMGQNLVPLVNIKIAGKWMFIPLKMVLIGIDPYPYTYSITMEHMGWCTWGQHQGHYDFMAISSRSPSDIHKNLGDLMVI